MAGKTKAIEAAITEIKALPDEQKAGLDSLVSAANTIGENPIVLSVDMGTKITRLPLLTWVTNPVRTSETFNAVRVVMDKYNLSVGVVAKLLCLADSAGMANLDLQGCHKDQADIQDVLAESLQVRTKRSQMNKPLETNYGVKIHLRMIGVAKPKSASVKKIEAVPDFM